MERKSQCIQLLTVTLRNRAAGQAFISKVIVLTIYAPYFVDDSLNTIMIMVQAKQIFLCVLCVLCDGPGSVHIELKTEALRRSNGHPIEPGE